MFQTIQRRASRIGSAQTKVILTIDLQTLELYHDEYLYPKDALIFLTLERGSKFSSSTEKEMITESSDVNPLNKTPNPHRVSFSEKPELPYFSSTLSKMEWNERLELVATLYKDVGSNTYHQKDAILKLRLAQKADRLKGVERSATVGKYEIPLHDIMNQMLASSSSAGEKATIPTRVYEREMKVTFQPNFQKTSLTFFIRVTPLQSHPSFSNPFNQFIYSINSPSQLDTSGVTGSGVDDDNISVSSLMSHDSGHSGALDVGFEYSDLRETRPMNVQPPSGIVETIRRTSLRGTPMRRESGNQGEEQQYHVSSHPSSGSLASNDVRENFYSNYRDQGAAKKLEGRRSMIISPRNSYHQDHQSGPKTSPIAPKSLSSLFPNASTSEDYDATVLNEREIDLMTVTTANRPLGPGNRKVNYRTSKQTSLWITAMFRTLAQENQLKSNHIQRLENELHLINQTNYIEKLELIKQLETLQHDMSKLKLQAASAATAAAAASVAKSRKKGKDSSAAVVTDSPSLKKKKSRSFFSPSQTIPEIAVEEDQKENKTPERTDSPQEMLKKTLQTAEKTIQSFRRSIDSNLQTIHQITSLRENSGVLNENEIENDDLAGIPFIEDVEYGEQEEEGRKERKPLIGVNVVSPDISETAEEVEDYNSEEMIHRESFLVPKTTSTTTATTGTTATATARVEMDNSSEGDPASSPAERPSLLKTASRGLSFLSSRSSIVMSSKYVPMEKYQLLEYEVNHCKRMIHSLEQGREEDQALIREVANRVTENCLKRANSEWELEKSRNQLIGYKTQNEVYKKEYALLQKRYYALKAKMTKTRQQYTNLEVQYEYRNSIQDTCALKDLLASRSSQEDRNKDETSTANGHDSSKELTL